MSVALIRRTPFSKQKCPTICIENMNMYPLVSVITPCYNSAAYLSDCIESVMSQTFDDWEMLIVDDCSTDDSARIIKEYMLRDSRIKYFRTEKPSRGPSIPRNIGIKQSRGKYIAFLDSDDVWLPNKLEIQLPLFNNECTAIAFSNYEKINEKGERHNRYVIVPAEVTYKQLLKGNVIGCLTSIFDTEKVGKPLFKNIGQEDYVLWLAILKQGFVAKSVDAVTALYRVRKKSRSSNKLKTLRRQWNTYVREERTGYVKAAYYFLHYAYKAFMKSLK